MATDMLCAFAQSFETTSQGVSPWFATISNDQRVKVWSTQTNALYAQLTEPQHLGVTYTSIAMIAGTSQGGTGMQGSSRASGITASSGLIAVGTKKGGITIWQLQTKESQKLGGQTGVGHSGRVTGLAFTADGSRLFSCGDDGMIFEWDIAAGRPSRSWQGSKQTIRSLALSPNGKYLLTADTVIKLWNLESDQPIATFTSHVDIVSILQWAPDSTAFASGAYGDRFVNVWQVPSGILTGASATSARAIRLYQIAAPSISISLDASPAAISFSQPLSTIVSSSASASSGKKKTANAAAASTSTSNHFHIGTVSASGTASVWSVDIISGKPTAAAANPDEATTVALSEPDCAFVVKNLSVTNKTVALVAGNAAASKLGNKHKNQSTTTRTFQGIATEGAICNISLAGVSASQAATSGCTALLVRKSHIQPRLQSVTYARLDSLDGSSKPEFLESVVELAPMSELTGDSMRLISSETMASDASVVSGANSELTLAGKRKELLGNVSNPTGSAAKAATMAVAPAKLGARLDDAAVVSAASTAGSTSGEHLHTKRLRLLALTSDYTRALAERVIASDKYVRSTKHAKASESAVSKAGSLEMAMTQALTARDDKLFEQCISVGSKGGRKSNSVHATIARLKPQHIVGLLSKCITKLQSNPNRGPLLMPWIRECLYTHTGFLLTIPSLTEPLAALHRIVEQRLQSFKRLLGLQGRLDLIMSQVNRSSQSGAGSSGESTAKVVYNEEEEEYKDRQDDDDEDPDFDDDDDAGVASRWGKMGYEDDLEDDDDDADNDDDFE